MTDLDDQLDRAQADGRISPADADVVREFGEFLSKLGPRGDVSPAAKARRRRALIEHADLCGLTTADVERLENRPTLTPEPNRPETTT